MNIPSVNAFASILNKNTIIYSQQKKDVLENKNLNEIYCDYILICTGTTPYLLEDN